MFHFLYIDLDDSDYFQLCKTFVEKKNFYAARGIDYGKNSTPFRIRLKPDAKLQT